MDQFKLQLIDFNRRNNGMCELMHCLDETAFFSPNAAVLQ